MFIISYLCKGTTKKRVIITNGAFIIYFLYLVACFAALSVLFCCPFSFVPQSFQPYSAVHCVLFRSPSHGGDAEFHFAGFL